MAIYMAQRAMAASITLIICRPTKAATGLAPFLRFHLMEVCPRSMFSKALTEQVRPQSDKHSTELYTESRSTTAQLIRQTLMKFMLGDPLPEPEQFSKFLQLENLQR